MNEDTHADTNEHIDTHTTIQHGDTPIKRRRGRPSKVTRVYEPILNTDDTYEPMEHVSGELEVKEDKEIRVINTKKNEYNIWDELIEEDFKKLDCNEEEFNEEDRKDEDNFKEYKQTMLEEIRMKKFSKTTEHKGIKKTEIKLKDTKTKIIKNEIDKDNKIINEGKKKNKVDKVAKPTDKAVNWCFTQFDLTTVPTYDEKTMACLVYQTETSDDGRTHYQGCVKYKYSVRFGSVKKDFGQKAHLERCLSWVKSLNYCSKLQSRLEGPYVYGAALNVKNLKQTNLTGLIINGQITKEDVYKKYGDEYGRKTFLYEQLFKLYNTPRAKFTPYNEKVIVNFISGPPGIGKSRFAITNCSKPYTIMNSNAKWLSNVTPQTASIIIDEIEKLENLTARSVLSLMDRDGSSLETKGGFVELNHRELWMLGNKSSSEVFNDMSDSPNALNRRVDNLVDVVNTNDSNELIFNSRCVNDDFKVNFVNHVENVHNYNVQNNIIMNFSNTYIINYTASEKRKFE